MTTPPPAYVEIVARRSTYVHIVTFWVFFFQVLIYFYFLEAAFAIYMYIYVTTTKVLFFIAQIAARTSTYVHIVPLWFSFCDFFFLKVSSAFVQSPLEYLCMYKPKPIKPKRKRPKPNNPKPN